MRDLSVVNEADGCRNYAILADNGVYYTALTNVSAVANCSGEINYGIHFYGENNDLTLHNVKAYAYQGGHTNAGIQVAGGADVTLESGVYQGSIDDWGIGINIANAETFLTASGVNATGADSADSSYGLSISASAGAEVHGGKFKTYNAYTSTIGISVGDSTSLEAFNVKVHGFDGTRWINGLEVINGGRAYLYGGNFPASGGTETNGIINWLGSRVEARGVTAVGEAAAGRNDGFHNKSGSFVILSNSNFVGSGGTDTRGIVN